MNLKKIIRGWYHKYVKKSTYHTVHLRGDLNPEQQIFFDNHNFLLHKGKWKKDLSIIDGCEKILEIGFGNGSHLEYLGNFYKNSGAKIFAVELDKISLFKMLVKIDKFGFRNLKLIHEDARTLVNGIFEVYFDKIFVLFPDPWPKRREQKRRLLKYDFVKKLISKVKKDGEIYLATDIDTYSEQIKEILEKLKVEKMIDFQIFEEGKIGLENFSSEGYDLRKIFETKFAQKAKKEGRENKVFLMKKII